MPVAVLLVEGNLDVEVLQPVLGLRVLPVGSKGSLRPRALEQRDEKTKNVVACYLRDRDFDSDPPTTYTAPVEDSRLPSGGPVLGWHWCRHEMESYLLEPALVEAATKRTWSAASYGSALMQAATRIAPYTSARWAVGIARRTLPPLRDLPTRPQLASEIRLPEDCTEAACSQWARDLTGRYLRDVDASLGQSAVDTSLARLKTHLASLTTPEEALIWHTGKDLLAALAPVLPGPFRNNAPLFRAELRNWVREHPTDALALFPEWQALHTALKN